MLFPSNCSVASFQVPTHCRVAFERKRFSTEFLESKSLCSFVFALRNLSNEAQKSFAASFIAVLLAYVNEVKPLYFQAIVPLLPSSFQPIAHHLLKERDFPQNFLAASIPSRGHCRFIRPLLLFEAHSSLIVTEIYFRIKVSLFFHLSSA